MESLTTFRSLYVPLFFFTLSCPLVIRFPFAHTLFVQIFFFRSLTVEATGSLTPTFSSGWTMQVIRPRVASPITQFHPKHH